MNMKTAAFITLAIGGIYAVALIATLYSLYGG